MTERAKKRPAPAAKKKTAPAAPKPVSLLAEEIRRPNVEVGKYLPWARALAGAARKHRATLLATPMTPEDDLTEAEIADFERAVARLADLQDEQERRQEATSNLTPSQRKNYAAARAAQKTVIDAIRHAFRADKATRAWCTQVALGTGVVDLHDDARKLAGFWSEHAAALARFTDARAALDQMVSLAAQLPEQATPDAESDKRHTRLRNAAWTLVDRTAARLCTAGRFALRGDPDERKRFRRVSERRRRKGA